MEENKNSTMQTKTIVGLILLIVALVVGIKLIFAGIEKVMPDNWAAQVWDDMQTEKGGTAPYDLRMIPKEEVEMYESEDLQNWLAFAQNEESKDAVYWLHRMDCEEYVLYIPEQDRVLENADLSATEETMPDGRVTLVLRARTPEESEEILPEEQLFAIKSESETWDGQRIKMILDGREQDVIQITSRGAKIYSEDGQQIGQN